MMGGFDGMKKCFARLGVVGIVAFGATGCSSIPEWVDPTTWVGDSGPSDTENAPGTTPDLAAIPDRPTPSTTADDRQQIAGSLAADRARAQYSSEALRGGTEPPAAPPPPPSAASTNQMVAPQNAPPSTPVAAPEAVPSDQGSGSGAADVASQDTTEAQPAPSVAAAVRPQPPAAPVASVASTVSPSDAALGFRPSTAPPLDPSIGQFMPPPIVTHRRTSSAADSPLPAMVAMGGPEAMSGDVVANLDALQAPAAKQAPVYTGAQGTSPTSVLLFPGDGTALNAEGRARVRAVVAAFRQAGGQGYVRIVGHSSSRTADMPLERHLEMIFTKSQDRANAVAAELIREGVPADHVLVEAVGDTQPVYYESMPKGEDGNRRAEIFLQS
jgi:outer membrane protein OmpA-like peptidoglycan-associated protein